MQTKDNGKKKAPPAPKPPPPVPKSSSAANSASGRKKKRTTYRFAPWHITARPQKKSPPSSVKTPTNTSTTTTRENWRNSPVVREELKLARQRIASAANSVQKTQKGYAGTSWPVIPDTGKHAWKNTDQVPGAPKGYTYADLIREKVPSPTNTATTSPKPAAGKTKTKKTGMFTHGIPIEGTDSFVNMGQIYPEFYHLPTGESVAFKGYITDFQDNYNVEFKKEDVYGRLDPIAIYSGTKRDITIGWTLVAETEEEAYDNLRRAQQYIQMLYPSYNKFKYGRTYSVSTLGSPPLLKMKFMNLIANSKRSRFSKVTSTYDSLALSRSLQYKTVRNHSKVISLDFSKGTAKNSGLLVIPGNMTVNHNLQDRGALLVRNDSGHGSSAIPFEITMSSTYTVLHEHDLGTRRGYKVTRFGGKGAKIKRLIEKIRKDEGRLSTMQRLNKTRSKSTQQHLSGTNSLLKESIKNNKKKLRRAQQTKAITRATGTGKTRGFDNFPYGAKEDIK